MLKGGCFCGHVRYEASGAAFYESNCHCSICRRTSGAPFVSWFSVLRPGFRILSGEPSRFESSAAATRSFCLRCGTQLTFEHRDFPDEIGITTCSLDDPAGVPPKRHIHTSSRLPWIELADGLTECPESWEQCSSARPDAEPTT
jgi:hypothetical protein